MQGIYNKLRYITLQTLEQVYGAVIFLFNPIMAHLNTLHILVGHERVHH